MTERIEEFLTRTGMKDPSFSVLKAAEKMRKEMELGLCGGESSYPMIPTYLRTTGMIPENRYAAVIDAGGTNFRCGLAHFENGRCVIEQVKKAGMPGVGESVSWKEFISFVADAIEELMPYTDLIGFCFSYSAEITPDIDGKVICIDKEVTVTGCEGQLVGKSLSEELEARGFPGKQVVILNDTAAVQLGGMAKHLSEGYTSCMGQVSGTGTNTCCTVPGAQIKKLNDAAFDMIVNLECGSYHGLDRGMFDHDMDLASNNPGMKRFEKLTAGVYLGELCRRTLFAAGEEGLLTEACTEKLFALGHIDSSVPDAWACGRGFGRLTDNEDDQNVISEIAKYFFRRSAKLMCANLIAMAMLTGAGLNGDRTAIFAEGSLVQKNHIYSPELKRLIEQYMQQELGRDITLVIEEDTTLPGAAAAVLLNRA